MLPGQQGVQPRQKVSLCLHQDASHFILHQNCSYKPCQSTIFMFCGKAAENRRQHDVIITKFLTTGAADFRQSLLQRGGGIFRSIQKTIFPAVSAARLLYFPGGTKRHCWVTYNQTRMIVLRALASRRFGTSRINLPKWRGIGRATPKAMTMARQPRLFSLNGDHILMADLRPQRYCIVFALAAGCA